MDYLKLTAQLHDEAVKVKEEREHWKNLPNIENPQSLT